MKGAQYVKVGDHFVSQSNHQTIIRFDGLRDKLANFTLKLQ